MKIEYNSNNSGGSWWLSEADWKALEKQGWHVDWLEEPLLDAPATRAVREGLPLDEAIREWEEIVGQGADAVGCPCCGKPHNFYEED